MKITAVPKELEKRALPTLAEARTRLEGALETVERGLEHCLWAKGLLDSQWRATAGRHQKGLASLRRELDELDAAAAKVLQRADRDGWPDDFEPRKAVASLQKAQADLAAELEHLLRASPSLTAWPQERVAAVLEGGRRGLAWLLDDLLLEVLPPARGEALFRFRTAVRDPRNHSAMGLLFAGVGLAALLFGRADFGTLLPLVLLCGGALVLSPWLFARGHLELLPDRLRKKTLFGTRELPLPKGGIHFDSLNASVRIAGWGEVTLKTVDEASALATLLDLARSPPFERLGPAPSEAIVLDGVWLEGDKLGALWLRAGQALFVLDGDETFDAAAGEDRDWPNPKARLLVTALAALPEADQQTVVQRLLDAGRAQPLATEEPFSLSQRALLAGGRVRAHFEPAKAQRVRSWMRLQSGQR